MKSKEYCKLKAEELKQSLKRFPGDFINTTIGEHLSLPPRMLYLGKEFFGKYEVTFFDGEPWRICNDMSEAKFLIYTRHNGYTEAVLPVNYDELKQSVAEYEKYLDLMMKEIKKEFLRKYPDEENFDAVAEVLRHLNLVRY